ncbi:hypothetical protein BHM03_00034749 [Ensete ventricosum]|nr:hypothetical protein BHM03_00034749 [Ensete ventricosum]
MHPLRFPNNSIRAKVFMRKIGFKLSVIRLNRVESFYALLLHFRSKDNKEREWLATAKPPTRVASHSLVIRKGAVDCGQGQPAREAGNTRKGRQMLVSCKQPPAGAASRMGDACKQKRLSGVALVEVPPSGAEPVAGAAASVQGSCRLRGGSDNGSDANSKNALNNSGDSEDYPLI